MLQELGDRLIPEGRIVAPALALRLARVVEHPHQDADDIRDAVHPVARQRVFDEVEAFSLIEEKKGIASAVVMRIGFPSLNLRRLAAQDQASHAGAQECPGYRLAATARLAAAWRPENVDALEGVTQREAVLAV